MQSTKIRSCIPSRNMEKLEASYLKLERRCVRDMSEENLKRKTQGVLGPTLGSDLSKMREIGVAGFTSINKQRTNHKYILIDGNSGIFDKYSNTLNRLWKRRKQRRSSIIEYLSKIKKYD